MKIIYLIVLVLIITNGALFQAKSEDSESKSEDVLKETTKQILEKKVELDKKPEIVEAGEINFKAKKANLWVKEKPQDSNSQDQKTQVSKSKDSKKPDEFVEVSLQGILYTPGKKIKMVEKKDVDRSTIENAVASVFSANKSGKLNWIVDNFVDSDQEAVRALFKDKKILEGSQNDSQKIISLHLLGQADYKDSVFVFLEQEYIDGRVIKESIPLKKTDKGWKVTNEFNTDKTYDIVFAAFSSGEVSLKGKESSEKETTKNKESKS